MASIWDFLGGERGQDRTRALNQFLNSNLDYYLGPTGIPDKVRSLNTLLNPIDQVSQAGADTVIAMDPNRSAEERKQAAINALVGTIGAAAPTFVAGRAGMPAANAIAETLTGFGGGVRNATDGIADAIPSDVMYAGRSLAEGDMRGVLDAFAPGRPAQGMGADAVRPSVADLRRQANIERFGYDPNDVPTPVMNDVESYAGSHRAPSRADDVGASLDNPTTMFGGDDIYTSNAARYFGHGDPAMDRESLRAINAARGNPNAEITVYRAIPKNLEGAQVNTGDWVTPSRAYAETHGQGPLRGDYQIIEQKVRAGDLFTEGDIHEWGYSPAAPAPAGLLPPPRTPAQEQARTILEMRAAGRASEVTDEMMAAADPEYMYSNTPLPMDEASRMARAEAAGQDRVMYHGGKGGYTEFDPDMADGKGYDTGTWLSDDADIAATYAGGVFDNASTYPVVADTKDFGSVDWRGKSWGDGDPYAYIRNPRGSDNFSDKLSTIYEDWRSWPSSDNAARAANYAGRSGVELKNIVDVGPNIFSRADRGKPLPEVATSFAVFDPSVIRSRFARFDPEFAHLRNLSAGVGGAGLLSMGYPQEEQY